MRTLRLALLPLVSSTLACGSVAVTTDAAPKDGKPADGAVATDGQLAIDAAPIDAAPPIDAAALVQPKFHWEFEGSLNNTGSVANYALTAMPATNPAYVAGKIGQAASLGIIPYYLQAPAIRAVLGTYAKVTIGFWLFDSGVSTVILDNNNRATAPFGGLQIAPSATTQTATICIATTTNSFLGGQCGTFALPSANAWHHWLIRYDGTGTGAGQGGPTTVYIDGALAYTRLNDATNSPVFNTTGMAANLSLGTSGTMIDDVKIYDQVFTDADQCYQVIGGTWNTATAKCTLP